MRFFLRLMFGHHCRFGLFETFRDKIAEHRPIGATERVVAGLASGACAATISCPAEVSLVRPGTAAYVEYEADTWHGPSG